MTFLDAASYDGLLWAWSLLGLGVFVVLCFLPAPYGRQARPGWGPTVDSRWGWVWMELAAVVTVPLCFYASGRRDALAWVWLALWELHYLHRTFVFPFRRGRATRRMPWAVVVMGATFNVVNGYVVGHGLFVLAAERSLAWLARPAGVVGLALFLAGMALQLDSDARLAKLRRASTGYSIPRGGGFGWVSSPNYLGEIVEWLGFALASGAPGAFVFAWWTIANLAPRAGDHQRWYRRQFADYPRQRRALLPYLW